MAGAGELPHSPYYGTIDSTPLWLILLGATFDWTGDRAFVDRLWPNALARARVDRRVRRPRRRRLRRVRAALDARACSTRAGRTPATRSATGSGALATAADRARRGPGLRLRREAADRRARRGPRRGRPRRPARSRGGGPAAPLRGRASGSRTSATTRWPSTARSGQADAIGSNAGQCLWTGIASPARARDVADRLLGPGDVLGLGHPDVRRRPAGLQPDRLPHRARSGRTTRR